MAVYILDTCIWSYWFNPKSNEHSNVNRHIEQLSDNDKLGISIITWGEIEWGHRKDSPDGNTTIQSSYIDFIKKQKPTDFFIDIHVTKSYGKLRAGLFKKFPPKTKNHKWPELCVDPVSSKELGIQENDLWIASQAITRNMVLVTNDKMANIKMVAGPELRIEYWAK